mmetsp:Transcript_35674/g.114668  ORF Transcript_35674/g.114668 Transcript_35674/m.114668 type:complete len:314 (-) Transcript_35674:752-1693(-)
MSLPPGPRAPHPASPHTAAPPAGLSSERKRRHSACVEPARRLDRRSTPPLARLPTISQRCCSRAVCNSPHGSAGQCAAARAKNVLRRGHVSQPEDADTVEVLEALLQPRVSRVLRRSEAGARVVELLVRLVGAVRVADLRVEVRLILLVVCADAVPVGPLRVRVDVHLDHAVVDRLLDVLEVGARPSVEDKGDGLGVAGGHLVGDEGLGIAQDLGVELDVARGIDAVHVAKSGGDGEAAVWNGGELLIHLPDLLGFGVEVLRVRILVVHPVLLAARDAQLHLEQHVELAHPLHVLDADGDVLLERLLGEVEHV